VKVGIDILDSSFLGRAHRISRSATIIMYSVLLLTVLVDLIVAVGVGVFVANILTIERLTRLPSTKVMTIDPSGDPVVVSEEERRLLDEAAGQIVLFHLSGPMIFGVAQAIARESAALERHPRALIIDLAEVSMLGTTVGLAIENVVEDAQQRGTKVWIAGASEEARGVLTRLGVLTPEVSQAPNRLEAIRAAGSNGQREEAQS
jgi:SulP family sulfate permease